MGTPQMDIHYFEKLYKKYKPAADVYQADLPSLQILAYAALVMAAIDNFMDEEEIQLAKGFVHKHWKPDFGDRQIFMTGVDRQVVEFLVPEGRIYDLEEQKKLFFKEITSALTSSLAAVLYCLIYDVMLSDGLKEERELGLLEGFVKEVGL